MWKAVLTVFMFIFFTGCSITTFKLAIFGDKRKFGKIGDYLTNPIWGLALLLLIPMFLGEYGRGEVSPIPWTAFQVAYDRHGLWDGIFTSIAITVVDLWALWLPGALYLESHPEVDKRTYYLVRTVNILVGLLLLTAGNPLALLLAHTSSVGGDPD
jgi:hypothetical protein